jgi:hypothetical protein
MGVVFFGGFSPPIELEEDVDEDSLEEPSSSSLHGNGELILGNKK